MQVIYQQENPPHEEQIQLPGNQPWMAVAFALGLAQAWINRFFKPDGVSADMGTPFASDWRTAISGYFNPLYGCLQAVALRFVLPCARGIPSFIWSTRNPPLFSPSVFPSGTHKGSAGCFRDSCANIAIFLWSSLQLTVSLISRT
jgi:hypothetical protein